MFVLLLCEKVKSLYLRFCGVAGDSTAPLTSYRRATAFILFMLKVRAYARCFTCSADDDCDRTAHTLAFYMFHGHRRISVRSRPWCDRGLILNPCHILSRSVQETYGVALGAKKKCRTRRCALYNCKLRSSKVTMINIHRQRYYTETKTFARTQCVILLT